MVLNNTAMIGAVQDTGKSAKEKSQMEQQSEKKRDGKAHTGGKEQENVDRKEA